MVKLTLAERKQLEKLVNTGKVAAHRRRRAPVLLLVDEGEHRAVLFDKDGAKRTGFTRRTNVCRAYPYNRAFVMLKFC